MITVACQFHFSDVFLYSKSLFNIASYDFLLHLMNLYCVFSQDAISHGSLSAILTNIVPFLIFSLIFQQSEGSLDELQNMRHSFSFCNVLHRREITITQPTVSGKKLLITNAPLKMLAFPFEINLLTTVMLNLRKPFSFRWATFIISTQTWEENITFITKEHITFNM